MSRKCFSNYALVSVQAQNWQLVVFDHLGGDKVGMITAEGDNEIYTTGIFFYDFVLPLANDFHARILSGLHEGRDYSSVLLVRFDTKNIAFKLTSYGQVLTDCACMPFR